MEETYKKIALLVYVLSLLIVAYGCASLKKSSNGAVQNEEGQETLRIERFKENVRRDGDTLYLKVESGAYLTLKDPKSCDLYLPCDYEFVDYYSDQGFYLIFAGYYESQDYIMISDKDGKEYSVNHLPILSPDKERFISASACEAFCINGVFIWRIVDGDLVSELFYKPFEPPVNEYALYSFIEWTDNKTILLSKYIRSIKEFCPKTLDMTHPVVLKLEDGEWRFYEDLSRDTVKCGPNEINTN